MRSLVQSSISSTPELFIGNDKLNEVKSFKYLGVNVDSSLKFQTHIDAMKQKLSQLSGVTWRLKNRVDVKTANKVYYSCVYSVMSYCIGAWGEPLVCSRRGNVLFRLQKRIVRNLFERFHPNSSNLFHDAHIMKLDDIYRLRASMYMYRVLNLEECPSLQHHLMLEYPAQQDHHIRNANSLREPFPRVESVRMSFRYQFVNIWNNIPNNIKNCRTLKSFKKNLINYYINSYVT